MRPITHRFTLDMHDTQSQISIPVHCGDSGRKLFITLSEGGKPYEIGEGCYAYINARTLANTTQSLMCNIANNTIEFDFSENNDAVNMIAVVGLTHCDVTLFDADGYIVTAPRFTFVVVDQISNPRDVELTSDNVSLLSDWTSKFASWNTDEDGRKLQEETRQSNELTRESQETTRQRLYEESKESLDNVISYANQAKASAENAKASEDIVIASKKEAAVSARNAGQSAINADEFAIEAQAYASDALKYANDAKETERRINDTVNPFVTRDDVDERINTLILASDPEGGKTIANIQNLVKYVDENAGEISALISAVDENTDKIASVQRVALEAKQTTESITTKSKNIYDSNTAIDGYALDISQEVGKEPKIFSSATGALSDFVSVEAGENYIFSKREGTSNNVFIVVFLDSKGIVKDKIDITAGKQFVVPEGTCNIRFSNSSSIMFGFGCQLEKGVSSTPYEPFGYQIKEDALRNTDYYAHYNYRVQQITANAVSYNEFDDIAVSSSVGNRSIAMLDINEGADCKSLWEGGKFTEYKYLIMHPKYQGTLNYENVCGTIAHVLVTKGVTKITGTYTSGGANVLDLTLFTGGAVFPTLYKTDDIKKVLVQKGRKAELQSMTNWSDCNIEEVETW